MKKIIVPNTSCVLYSLILVVWASLFANCALGESVPLEFCCNRPPSVQNPACLSSWTCRRIDLAPRFSFNGTPTVKAYQVLEAKACQPCCAAECPPAQVPPGPIVSRMTAQLSIERSYSFEIEPSVQLSLLAVKGALAGAFGHQWSISHTFSVEVQASVPMCHVQEHRAQISVNDNAVAVVDHVFQWEYSLLASPPECDTLPYGPVVYYVCPIRGQSRCTSSNWTGATATTSFMGQFRCP